MRVNEAAVTFLSNIQGKLCVVAIVGEYRVGKSFLMTQLTEDPKGFKIGHTRDGCTKGLWLWDKVKTV